jgi:hypothetical protein
MTEADWLRGGRPLSMLGYLLDSVGRARYPDHRFRLFACACVRQVQALLGDHRSRLALAVAQRYALGQTDRRGLAQARNAAREASLAIWQDSLAGNASEDAVRAAHAALDVTTQPGHIAAWQVCQTLFPTLLADWSPGAADLVHDIFGNPFQTPRLPEHWRTWNDRTIPRLARHIHERYRHAELPILADALEEAGCTDESILSHCRSGSLHVPGCWVLELLVEE